VEQLGIPPARLLESVGGWTRRKPCTPVQEAASAALSAAVGTKLPLMLYRIPLTGKSDRPSKNSLRARKHANIFVVSGGHQRRSDAE
jgi:hypothetical protein